VIAAPRISRRSMNPGRRGDHNYREDIVSRAACPGVEAILAFENV
jgi:hypothetical protein